jgi:DNA-binding response OmpR family regulator
MSNAIKVHLLLEESPVRVQLEAALKNAGFDISSTPGGNPTSENGADVFIIGQRQIEKFSPASGQVAQNTVIKVGQLELHALHYEAYCSGLKLPLTASEFQMLKVLCEHRPQVLTRQRLVEIFTHLGFELSLRTIDNHIFNLRKKLGECESMILTIRGVGYKIQS